MGRDDFMFAEKCERLGQDQNVQVFGQRQNRDRSYSEIFRSVHTIIVVQGASAASFSLFMLWGINSLRRISGCVRHEFKGV